MTDGTGHVGVGMTMTRINSDGEVEPIKDRHIEKRVNWLLTGNIAELQRRYDEWMRQAEIERQKSEARRVAGSRWQMKHHKEKECLQIAHSYKVVIDQLRGESA